MVLLSGGRFDAAVATGVQPTAKGQTNISDVLVWVGDEQGRGWRMYSVSYQHNLRVGCRTKALNVTVHGTPAVQTIGCTYSGQVNSTKRNPAPPTTAYTSLVRLNDTAALLTYDMLTSPRVMWSMELATEGTGHVQKQRSRAE